MEIQQETKIILSAEETKNIKSALGKIAENKVGFKEQGLSKPERETIEQFKSKL